MFKCLVYNDCNAAKSNEQKVYNFNYVFYTGSQWFPEVSKEPSVDNKSCTLLQTRCFL